MWYLTRVQQALPLLGALSEPAGSPSLHLAKVDCEVENVLCAAMGVVCPTIWHFHLPQLQPGQQTPKSPLHIVYLNASTPDPIYIASLPLAAEGVAVKKGELYDGWLHPIDGTLVKVGMLTNLGYVLHFMGTTPSWMIMIAISFFSRQFMTKKTLNRANRPEIYGQQGAAAPNPSAPAAGKPEASPAAAGKSSGSASKSSKKKR